MAFFILGFIFATVFLISSILFISLSSKSSNTPKKHPPGRTGWPIIGENISFASSPERFIRDRMIKHSPDVFQTSIAGERVAVFCGPAGNKFIFSNDTKLVKPWWPKVVSKALLFDSTNSSSPLISDHSFLRHDSMQQYVSVMDSTCQDHIQQDWVTHDVVKAHHLAKKFTFALSCRLFINYDGEKVKELAEPFFAILRGLVSAPLDIPGTPFNGAMKGGVIIKEKLVAIIKQRKRELLESRKEEQFLDLLTKLLLAAQNDGRGFSDQEIAVKIIVYLIASFVTTSNAMTYVLSNLADQPHVYDRVLIEQQEIAKSKQEGELLTWEDIKKMKYSWNVVCESMRLMSPSFGAFKEVLTDINVSGFDIPKGWKAFWTTHSTNKDPKYFTDPEKFDPSRFEGDGPQPYTFVPFGGGPHMCPGNVYARIGILVFVHNVVTRFKFKKVKPNEKINYFPDPTPVEGLPLQLQCH